MRIPRSVRGLLQEIGEIAWQAGGAAYAVGGCVRDWRLRYDEVVDVDVTVDGSGIEVARAVARHVGGTVTTHEQFGTASVAVTKRRGGRAASPLSRIDFASCRKETYAKPAAYPKVSRGTLEDDLFRRDFTINAMALTLDPGRFEVLVDPFRGVQDLARKRLRVLHPRSFFDDPSRILRGVRFAQRFGLRWDPETLRAARAAIAAGGIGWLNIGRLRRELDRFLEEPSPRACIQELGWLLAPPTRGRRTARR